MAVLAGGLNLVMAVVYVGIGTIVAIDLEGAIRRRGYSHFGVAWLTIMFTCGAHHLVHGVHLVAEGREISGIDVLATLLGIPVGVVWSRLRLEASAGGRGDRFLRGDPLWLRTAAVVYVAGTVAGVVVAGTMLAGGIRYADPRLIPNVLLCGLYIGIGLALWRGQRRNHAELGGWSLSGLSLMAVFPTCALMHGIYVVDAATARFSPDFHGLWADWLGVPAAVYFFWVVYGMERGTVTDWNQRFEAIEDLAPHADHELAVR